MRTIAYSQGRSAIGPVGRAQSGVGADERILNDIFGVVGGLAQDAAREHDQLRAEAMVNLRKRSVVSAANAGDELVVAKTPAPPGQRAVAHRNWPMGKVWVIVRPSRMCTIAWTSPP